eukprot:Platyproteum_vivax@DN7673_c1_g2_i10.p3
MGQRCATSVSQTARNIQVSWLSFAGLNLHDGSYVPADKLEINSLCEQLKSEETKSVAVEEPSSKRPRTEDKKEEEIAVNRVKHAPVKENKEDNKIKRVSLTRKNQRHHLV